MKVLAIAQLIIYVAMDVIGISIGYAIGASTAPPPKALTITMPGATSTATVREVATKTLTITATPALLGIKEEILLGP